MASLRPDHRAVEMAALMLGPALRAVMFERAVKTRCSTVQGASGLAGGGRFAPFDPGVMRWGIVASPPLGGDLAGRRMQYSLGRVPGLRAVPLP